MIEDAYVRMLVRERNRLDISTKALCEGVYDEDMFYLVEQGKRSMDRVTAKRLLARLGVDNSNYEHYLDYPDYEVWQTRMQIINLIEIGKFDEAEERLKEYSIGNINGKNVSRDNIEKQFILFMKTQILKNKKDKDYTDTIDKLYEDAVKLTVPNIDKKPIERLVLSPLETNLVFEYKIRRAHVDSVDEKMAMYRGFLEYIEKAPYGKVSATKIYPKVATYMYNGISKDLFGESTDNIVSICLEVLDYVTRAKHLLAERKLLYYMVEILESKERILGVLIEHDSNQADKYIVERENISSQLNELKKLYTSYEKETYMTNDCYLYRESGIYCANDVIKLRRKMLGLTQDQLCGDDISLGTLKRIEGCKKAMKKETLKLLFSKLKLYPSCVNMGIVTDKKQVLEKYENIRFAIASFKTEELKTLIYDLKEMLYESPINKQVILRIENLNKWRAKEITDEQFVENLQKALECTIRLEHIKNTDDIFITTEELMTLCSISSVYKECSDYEKAMCYIEDIWKYCKVLEEQGMESVRMGIYELVMEYMGNLLGDMGQYEESNDTSHKLTKISLQLRRAKQIHANLYNIAWNNMECNKDKDAFNNILKQCIIISQLMDDAYDEAFYRQNLL